LPPFERKLYFNPNGTTTRPPLTVGCLEETRPIDGVWPITVSTICADQASDRNRDQVNGRQPIGVVGVVVKVYKEMFVIQKLLPALVVAMTVGLAAPASAVSSAELYTTQVYRYGRFEARLRFAAGDGVISSFFLWKPNSQVPGTFWNELDFEKLGADCHLQTNPLYGLAPLVDRGEREELAADLCGEYHTYTFEWAPDYIAYLVDGVEVRRDTGEAAAAFEDNAPLGMEIHFNVWPGDATFGGIFDPAIMPVDQAISWVQYSSYADGAFTFAWREDFTGGVLPSGWAVGDWPAPKPGSTHSPANVGFVDGF
jgi:endo-1,3-1,4-beta-glycanase ExoK